MPTRVSLRVLAKMATFLRRSAISHQGHNHVDLAKSLLRPRNTVEAQTSSNRFFVPCGHCGSSFPLEGLCYLRCRSHFVHIVPHPLH